MVFWSGEHIRQNLPQLVDQTDPKCIHSAAYALKIGVEYYTSPEETDGDRHSRSVKKLEDGEAFAIPPGQFAYIMTRELVTIPWNVLGFISIRARVKWKGLINVSGFHVDPGYTGRLTFAVFNAGPAPVHLREGDPAFLIWFADLTADAKIEDARKDANPTKNIDVDILNHVAGEVHSLSGLASKLQVTEKELRDRLTNLERMNGIVSVAAGALIALIIAVLARGVFEVMQRPAAPTLWPASHHAFERP